MKNKIPDSLEEYIDSFDELGCFPKMLHIILTDRSSPMKNPPRCVPIALQTKLYDELHHMVKMGVIVTVEEPMDWSSSFAAVEKPDHTLYLFRSTGTEQSY